MYKHINNTAGTFSLSDSKGNRFALKPGETVELDVKREVAGIIVEQAEQKKKSKPNNKYEESE